MIITLWQIDTFEGGVGSRKQFLLKAASMYEKNNDGVLIMVTNHTLEGAENNMKNGIFPDMISYGAGLDVKSFSEIKTKNVRSGGLVGNKCYATPWCKGGYVLISNPNLVTELKPNRIDKLLVSQSLYTQPLTALLLEGVTAHDVEIKKPMDAYVKFVIGKTPYMLGTQRDIHRLINRGFEFNAQPLYEFCDLNQYVSITTAEEIKRYYANDFINFLTSDVVQKKLTDIGMFSPYIEVGYSNQTLSIMQKINAFKTYSVFLQKHKLIEMQEISLSATAGDQSALNKIKNLLI